MTDTPTIALYYKEHDPMKERCFLISLSQQGKTKDQCCSKRNLGDSLWRSFRTGTGYTRRWIPGIVDGMEYSKDAAGRMFGGKRARKEVERILPE